METRLPKGLRDLGSRWPEVSEVARRAVRSPWLSSGQARPAGTGNGRPVLSSAEVESFFAEGYLIKEGLVSAEQVASINEAVERCWQDRSIYNPLTISAWTTSSPRYTETYLREIDRSAREDPYKLNHLYLYDHRLLSWIMSSRLKAMIAQLISGSPLLFNGLNMERGTEQRFHFDTLYMPPRSKDRMVVAWIALEDILPGAGALRYYPRSHLIEPYVFSSGRISAIAEEMSAFDRYMDAELRRRGLQWVEFYPKKGDVFLWHSQLYHGGSPIEDPTLSRRSMVLHFWRVEDLPPEMCLRVSEENFILDPRYMPVALSFTPSSSPREDPSSSARGDMVRES